MTVEPARDLLDQAALERLHRIGGQDFLVEMIDLFLEHAPQRLATARTAHGDADIGTVYRAAHSVKSTAANLGASALQAAAARVEEEAAAENMVSIAALLDEMNRQYERVRPELEAERDRRKGAGT